MANEVQLKTYTTVNHIVSATAGVSAGAFNASSEIDTSVDNTTNLAPLCNVILTVTFGTNPTAGDTIDVYRRDLNIVSTNDEPDTDANFKQHYVGSLVVDVSTSAQYLQLSGVPLPPTGCDFFIYNSAAQAISSGWALDVQPYTFAPAA